MDIITRVYMKIKLKKLTDKLIKLSGHELHVGIRQYEKVQYGGYSSKIKTLLFNYEAMATLRENVIVNIICHEIGHIISHQVYGTYSEEFNKASQYTKEEEFADKLGQEIYDKLNLNKPYFAPSRDTERVALKELLYQSYISNDNDAQDLYIKQLKALPLKLVG